ncbi:MAG: spore coat protein CotH [Clostridiales bacterium]|jgi:spore coat protein CotH|nr:spore coat protein CotH [Clostridiales bacterium]
MSTHKYIDKICCVIVVLSLIFTVLFMNAKSFGVAEASRVKGYEARLFDTSTVHTIDIVMDDWDSFIDTCTNEEYALCSVVIDNEAYKNVAIRAKGNTSLTQVESYGNDRYSFKIEFDHYDSTKSYYGLDKLSLNNIIQDNTYMKDFLTYQMMQRLGADAPLCSYVNITVNGENWGLYLAVESIEEAFLERNYGSDYGELYKPDSMSMGGGRGNGDKFDMADWAAESNEETISEIKDALEKMDDTQLTEILEKFGYSNLDDLLSALENADSMEEVLNGVDIRELLTGKGKQTNNSMMGGMTPPGMFENGGSPNENQNNQMQQNGQNGMQPPNGQASADGEMPQIPNGERPTDSDFQGGAGGGMGSDDVKLIYSDDEYDSYTNIFDNAKTDITDADKDRLIASLKQLNSNENIDEVVNIDGVIRYFVVHNFVCNFDSYTGSMIHNYYLYEEDGQLSMIPWDYNLAFGGFQDVKDANSLVNYPIDSPVSSGTVDSRPMLAWIFSNEEYTELYHKYFAEFIVSYFDSGYFSEMIETTREMIAPFVESDATKFCTYEEFQTGVDTLKEFCLLRAESVRGQLDGTIASTSDGQTQDSSSLIDASTLNISDMGSMGNGKGGGMDKPNVQNDARDKVSQNTFDEQSDVDDNDTQQEQNDPTTNSSPNEQQMGGVPPDVPKNEQQNGDTSISLPNKTQRDTMQPIVPDGEQPSDSSRHNEIKSALNAVQGEIGLANTQMISVESWVMISVSCLVLIVAILIAVRYKKRS